MDGDGDGLKKYLHPLSQRNYQSNARPPKESYAPNTSSPERTPAQ